MSGALDYLNWGYDEIEPLIVKDDAWHAERRASVGASDSTIIMNGDDDALMRLWREKRGELECEDLSDVLPVLIGTITEPLNRYVFTKRTGRKIVNVGDRLSHDDYPFMHVTLDGETETERGEGAIFEAKHVNPFNFKPDNIIQKYFAQCQHGMAIRGHSHAILSVLVGTLKWEHMEIEADIFYQGELIERANAFWECVKSGKPPCVMEAAAIPDKVIDFKPPVDMTGNNEWATFAHDWIKNKEGAEKFKSSVDGIKGLMEADYLVASGYGIQCKRDKKGALRISEAE